MNIKLAGKLNIISLILAVVGIVFENNILGRLSSKIQCACTELVKPNVEKVVLQEI